MSKQMDQEIRTFTANHPKSKTMQAEASKYLPGGSSRATAYFDPYPFFVDKASGHHVYDVDGNSYLDFIMKHFFQSEKKVGKNRKKVAHFFLTLW